MSEVTEKKKTFNADYLINIIKKELPFPSHDRSGVVI